MSKGDKNYQRKQNERYKSSIHYAIKARPIGTANADWSKDPQFTRIARAYREGLERGYPEGFKEAVTQVYFSMMKTNNLNCAEYLEKRFQNIIVNLKVVAEIE